LSVQAQGGHNVEIFNNAKLVEDALKTLGEPVRLKDLVELTKDKVSWKPLRGQTGQMKTFMNQVSTIKKASFGFYQYLDETSPKINAKSKKTNNKKKEKSKEKIKRLNEEKTKVKENVSEQTQLPLIEESEKTTKNKIPKIDETVNKNTNLKGDDSVLEVSEKDKELLDNFRKIPSPIFIRPKNTFKVGEIVEGKVSGVEEYGAFIENEDASMQGLIHITNIRNGITDDVMRHFKIGDKVKAKIISIKAGGKLALSTRDFDLPDYFKNNEMVDKLKPVQEMLKNAPMTSTSIELEKSNGEAKMEAKMEAKTIEEMHDSEEIKQVFRYIQGITGVVSEKAKQRIREMVEQKGVFKFTLALADIKSDFEVDVSMMFVNEIDKKMSDSL
jgi:general stress protein 13